MFMYCMTRETYDRIYSDFEGNGLWHIGDNLEACTGEFTTSEPPEMTEEMWNIILEEDGNGKRQNTSSI